MSITCLAIGDPHFRDSNLPDAKELIRRILVLVRSTKPTFVVVLGDLLHTHEKIYQAPLDLATKLITSLAKAVPTFLIVGNHDYCNNQQFLTDKHPFNSFKEIENVTVCDQPSISIIDGRKFVFCPYTPPDRFEEALETLEEKWDDATCIFAHQEFYGCRFNPVRTSTEGDIWPNEYPLVVSGHIHNRQWLQENIYYTGSSLQHAFGETANKTVALITFTEKVDIQEVDLELPKKKMVYVDISKAKKFKPQKGVYTKLVIKGTPEEIKTFRGTEEYTKLQHKGVTVSFAPQVEKSLKIYTKKKGIFDILEELIEKENKDVQNAFKNLKSLE